MITISFFGCSGSREIQVGEEQVVERSASNLMRLH